MALKFLRSLLTLSFIAILFTGFVSVDRAHALSGRLLNAELPPLDAFVSHVQNGQAGELRGVYIPEILAAPVVQQPMDDNQFVSPRQNIVTQFSLASQIGSTGLLAHDYLAGEYFSLLQKDQIFYLIYGDGRVSTFVVTEILRYEALEPTSTSSRFLSLEDGNLLSAPELFSKIYNRPGKVMFQTCISSDTNPSWGRLFIIAEPYAPSP